MDTKCNLEAFKNTRGNFLDIPEADLILYKKCIGKNCRVYCFTYDEAKVLLKQKIPKLPGTDIKLPDNFMDSLRKHITTLSPQAYIKDSQVSSNTSQSRNARESRSTTRNDARESRSTTRNDARESRSTTRNDATRIERIPGEVGTVVTNLDWDPNIEYCEYVFDRFINETQWGSHIIPTYESYIQLVEQPQHQYPKGCVPQPQRLVKVIMEMKKTLPVAELNEHKWILSYHNSYPGLQFDNNGEKKNDNLPATNIFNDAYKGDIINFFNKKMTPAEYSASFGIWGTRDIQLEPGYNVEDIRESEASPPLYKLTKGDITYELSGADADNIAKDVLKNNIVNICKKSVPFRGEEGDYKRVDIKSIPSHAKVIHDAKIYLSGIYKIHLQPKPEYQIWTMRKVFDILNNPNIRPYVDAFKVLLPYNRLYEKQLPAIVIYPNYGKNTAQIVLDAIVDGLHSYNDIGIDIVPRYNHKFNNLIYWANGNGDDKEALRRENLLDEYYDKTANYAHILCDNQEDCHIEPHKVRDV